MINIWFGNQSLQLSESEPDGIFDKKEYFAGPELVHAFVDLLISDSDWKTALIFGIEEQILFDAVTECFDPVRAAGGLVINPNGDWLFIFRKGKWDLPKGKAEKKEKPVDTAIREVCEETGLTKLKQIGDLGKTYHTYSITKKLKFKTTRWFIFENRGEPLVPQQEEEITWIEWISPEKLHEIKENTYPSILELLSREALKPYYK